MITWRNYREETRHESNPHLAPRLPWTSMNMLSKSWEIPHPHGLTMPSNTIKIPHIAPHRPGVGGGGSGFQLISALGPLHMSPVDRAASVTWWILPWVHMRNFSPVSEMRKGQRSWGRVLAPNSGNKANMAKHKILTFGPILASVTLKAKWDAYDVENTAGNTRRCHPDRQNSSRRSSG